MTPKVVSWNDPSGLNPLITGVVIVVGGGALIYGGSLFGGGIVQVGNNAICLARDVLNSDERRREREILESACRNGIAGACNRLQEDARRDNAALRENVSQGGSIAHGAGSRLNPTNILNALFRGK